MQGGNSFLIPANDGGGGAVADMSFHHGYHKAI